MIDFKRFSRDCAKKIFVSHTLTHTSHRFLPQPLDPTILSIRYSLALTKYLLHFLELLSETIGTGVNICLTSALILSKEGDK